MILPYWKTNDYYRYWLFKNSTKKLAKAKAPLHFSPEYIFRFCLTRSTGYWSLEVLWTNFHLWPLDRLTVVFPLVPTHSVYVIFTIEVQTIEVWLMAIFVPPGAFVTQGTVAWGAVIIPIFGGKCWATMVIERITSRAWEKIKIFTLNCLQAEILGFTDI